MPEIQPKSAEQIIDEYMLISIGTAHTDKIDFLRSSLASFLVYAADHSDPWNRASFAGDLSGTGEKWNGAKHAAKAYKENLIKFAESIKTEKG